MINLLENSLKAIVIILAFGIWATLAQSIGTYMQHGYHNNEFATTTAFLWKHANGIPVKNDLMTVTIDQRTCTAVHTSYVSRHATRYVGVDDMRDFTKIQNKIKYSFENQNYSFVETWANNYPEEKAEAVAHLGEYELEYLGVLFANRLHGLLSLAVEDSGTFANEVRFTATYKTRTQTSAKLFSGWLSKALVGINKQTENVMIRNDVLRFYKNCKAYDEATSDDLQEVMLFEQGPHFQGVIRNVVERLNLNGTFTADELKILYKLCSSELAINNNPEWCTLFSDEDLDILQYHSDIADYMTNLYGHHITGQMSCPLVSDIFTAMDNAIQGHNTGQNYTIGKFDFAHKKTVLNFFAGLGLFKDHLPLTANNYEQLKNRKFKTSAVGPFSAHLAFVLYNCGGTSVDDYAVQMLVNGEPEVIPACNSSVCRYQDVRRGYSHMVEGCHWQTLCNTGQVNPGSIVG